MLEWVLESSVLIVFVLALRKGFSGKVSYLTIYALWGVVLVRLLLPVNPVSSMSFWNVIPMAQNVIGGQDLPENPVQTKNQEPNQNQEMNKLLQQSPETMGSTNSDSKQETVGRDTVAMPETGNGKDSEKGSAGMNFLQILQIFWLLGALLLFGLIAVANLCLSQRLKRNRVLLGVRGRVNIYQTKCFDRPCLYGVFRPAIYLPEALSFQEQETEQIITHEWVHYRHRDHIWAVLRVIILSVHWFNPLVWLAVIYSRKDAELACDEGTVRYIGEDSRLAYGEMLLRLAETPDKKEFLYAMSQVSHEGKDMKKRIQAISAGKTYKKILILPLVLFVLLAVGVTSSKAEPELPKTENETAVSGTAANSVDTGKPEAKDLPEELKQYDAFLQEHRQDKKYQYYSLAQVGDSKCYVLLVSETVQEISAGDFGSYGYCQIYSIVDGKITLCGRVTNGNDRKWLHFFNDRILTNTSNSITKIWLERNSKKLFTKKRELIPKISNGKRNYSDYLEWENELLAGFSIIFYTNPYTDIEAGEKDIPEKLFLNRSMENYAKKAYVQSTTYGGLDLTQDGIEDELEVKMDKVKHPGSEDEKTVILKSGATGKNLWECSLHTGKKGHYALCLYEENGKNYLMLMTWGEKEQTYLYPAIGRYMIFFVRESGKEKILHGGDLHYLPDSKNPKEVEMVSLGEFIKNLDSYLKKADFVVSTIGGKVMSEEDFRDSKSELISNLRETFRKRDKTFLKNWEKLRRKE